MPLVARTCPNPRRNTPESSQLDKPTGPRAFNIGPGAALVDTLGNSHPPNCTSLAMGSTERPLVPFKGIIFFSVSACVGLWQLGAKAEQLTAKHGEEIAALRGQAALADPEGGFEAIDLGSPEALEAQLAPLMPLAGLDPLGLAQLGLGDTDEEEDEDKNKYGPKLPSVEEVRAARPAGWVYPAFDAPAEGLHGAPATDLPRNIHFQVVDEIGMPLPYDALRVYEQTINGPVEVAPYCASAIAAEWTFGVRRLMTGSTAYFLVETEVDGQTLGGTLRLEDIHAEIDVDAGRVHLKPKTEAAWGSETTVAEAARPAAKVQPAGGLSEGHVQLHND